MLVENANINMFEVQNFYEKDVNEEATFLVNKFEFIFQNLHSCISMDPSCFVNTLSEIEVFKSQGKFDTDQLNRILSIVIDTFPLTEDPILKGRIVEIACQDESKNIYNLLLSAKKMNSLTHIQDCLSVMNLLAGGAYFSASDTNSVSICVNQTDIESEKIQEQICAIACVFNKHVSINMPESSINQGFRFLQSSNLSLPCTIIGDRLEWGYMTETLKALGNLFNQYQGLCIGECHLHLASKDFIIDNMEFFKSRGVNQIFIEQLTNDLQKDLDHCYNTGEFSQHLIDRIDLCLYKYGIIDIIKEATKHRIRVIAIDHLDYHVKDCDSECGLRERLNGMNRFAVEKINNYMSLDGNGKFLALMGANHLVKVLGVPGICDRINCPPVLISDLNDRILTNATEIIQIAYSSAFQNFGT